jgi:hypothetical protein
VALRRRFEPCKLANKLVRRVSRSGEPFGEHRASLSTGESTQGRNRCGRPIWEPAILSDARSAARPREGSCEPVGAIKGRS